MATAPARLIDAVALKRRHPVADVPASYGVALRARGKLLVG